MTQSTHRIWATALIAAAGAVVTACSSGDNATSPITVKPTVALALGDVASITSTTAPNPAAGKIELCKLGNVDGTFTIAATPFGTGSPTVVATPVTVTAGTCVEAVDDNDLAGSGSNVVISETSAGLVSDTARLSTGGAGTVETYVDNSTSLIVNSFHGWTVVYVDFVAPPPPPPPPPPSAGCSMGYFKNHNTTGDAVTVNSVFSGTGVSSSLTMQGALSLKGGSTLQDKKNLLLVQAAAAYLNIQYLAPGAYSLTLADLVSQVDAALASGDATTIMNLQATLNGYNNLEGPQC